MKMSFSYPPLCVQTQYSAVILRAPCVHCCHVGFTLHVNREKQLHHKLSGDDEALFRQITEIFLGLHTNLESLAQPIHAVSDVLGYGSHFSGAFVITCTTCGYVGYVERNAIDVQGWVWRKLSFSSCNSRPLRQ